MKIVWLKLIRDKDPVKHCALYLEEGCAHVDGYLCDFPDCTILKDFKSNLLNVSTML